MKNVWILNHYAQEPGRPGGIRHFSLAKYLIKFGWDATIIAASTEHKTGKQRLYKGESSRIEYYEKVRFLWIRTPDYYGNSFKRIKNMLHYSISVLKKRNIRSLQKPDIIIGSSVHPFAAWAAMRLARRFKVPFIFEVRDLWPQTLIDMGQMKEKSIIAVLLRKLEKTLYKKAKKIITLLPNAYEYIRRYDIDEQKIIWIPNGVDLDNYPEPEELKPVKIFTLMYFGAFGPANGLDNVLHAMSLVKKENHNTPIRLRLIGDGPKREQLKELAQQLKLDNVSFEEPVAKKNIPYIASQADAFIFNLIDTDVFKYGISSNKLFDFMAAARPILFSCKSSNNPVEEAKCGITVDPDNPIKMARAISEICNMDFITSKGLGLAARKYVEKNHDFRILAERLASCLISCTEQ